MTIAMPLARLKQLFEIRLAYAQTIPSSVARLLLTVTGPDFSQIEANIDIATGRVTVNVPLGNDRVFEVRAFPAASSALNFIGRTTANVASVGTTVTVNMQSVSLQPPMANAGADQAVLFVGQTVQLDGSASSDADGDPLTFAWAFTSRPATSQATLANPTLPNPTFVADVLGTYVLQLIVHDGTVASLADTVIVTADNVRPMANAGADQAVLFVGQTVQLDGSASSDADGDPLTFAWAFTSRPATSQATLSSPTLVNPTFIADVLGTYVLQLIVHDGTVASLADTVIVTADNVRPMANAGADQAVLFVGQTVQLDGSASSDADGDPLTFAWAFTSRPAASQATLSNPTLVNPTFVADEPGTYVLQLIVHDGTVDSLPDTVLIAVEEYYDAGSIDSMTRFASIIGTASLTVMLLGVFSRKRDGRTNQRIRR
jgi:acyl-coenzyme A thioesterase PaaI-like protein